MLFLRRLMKSSETGSRLNCMTLVIVAVLFIAAVSEQPFVRTENPPAAAPTAHVRSSEFSRWQVLGERRVSAGFEFWGQQHLLVLSLSKGKDTKPTPIGRLKVTVLDLKGKPLAVSKYYEYPYLDSGTETDTAFFAVGTPVQKIQPKDVSEVFIAGFGGKVHLRFTNGNPIVEEKAQ